MADRLREIPAKLLERWNKFSKVQKTLLISSVAVVAAAMAILGVVLSRPTLVTVLVAEDTKQAAGANALFEEAGMSPEVSADGLTFKVDKSLEAKAALLLGENDITSSIYKLENVFDQGFTATEADKTKKYQLYLEEKLAAQLEEQEAVETATVSLSIPREDGTILAEDNESSANITLSLNDEVSAEQAEGFARSIAAALRNKSTENILIMSTQGEVLFMGTDSDSAGASAALSMKSQENADKLVKNKVKELLLTSKVYDNVSVAPHLDVFLDQERTQTKEYWVDDPTLNHGPIDEESNYASESTGGNAAVPGTVANGGVTNVIPDNGTNQSTVNDETRKYKTNERFTDSLAATGNYDPTTSSISLVATSYRRYNQAEMEASGALGNQTFAQFAAANQAEVKTTVDPDFLTSVSQGTGIPVANISILAYEIPFFEYDDAGGFNFMDLLPIILAVLIMLMLGFVVFRSTRKDPAQVLAEELSVEALLESTKEAQEEQLEDIGLVEKSETRVMIEKFVEENPEAVASLLRNWLNEEWE